MKNDIIVEINLTMLLQKLIGLLLVVGSIVLALTLLEGDATICLITVPMGVAAMFSRKRIFM
jgi:hypothetical protein